MKSFAKVKFFAIIILSFLSACSRQNTVDSFRLSMEKLSVTSKTDAQESDYLNAYIDAKSKYEIAKDDITYSNRKKCIDALLASEKVIRIWGYIKEDQVPSAALFELLGQIGVKYSKDERNTIVILSNMNSLEEFFGKNVRETSKKTRLEILNKAKNAACKKIDDAIYALN